MARRRSLSDLDHRLLDHIGRLRFVTSTQLAYWCDCTRMTVDRRLAMLCAAGLVKAEKHWRPFVFALSAAGSAAAAKPRPAGNHQASWSVMSHACHAAQIEIDLHQARGFKLLDRLMLLKQGFNPAHGEHAGVDDTKTSTFVLLDDYGMQSHRIDHVWTRRHTPHEKHWPDPTGRVWSEVVNRFVVATTDPKQADRHRRYIESRGVAAAVMMVRDLWA
jgi:hypothetical protein